MKTNYVMTAKGKAAVRRFQKRQNAFREDAVRMLRKLSPDDRLHAMVKAGVLTPEGKLTDVYRSRDTASAAR